MRRNRQLAEKPDAASTRDPRDGAGAEVIDLATRNVLPQVARGTTRSDGFGLAAGITIAGLLGLLTLWNMNESRIAPPGQTGAEQVPASAVQVPPQAITTIPPQPAPVPLPGRQVMPPEGTPQGAPMQQPALAANTYAAPTVVYDSSAAQSSVPPARVVMPADPTADSAAKGGDDFAARIGGVGGAAAIAAASINPKTTVAQGTLIPAVLETAIDTDVPGYVRAIVSSDVRSFDGTRVLVPRSSRLIGQYKSGVQAGQKRAYVIWTRLIRPDGVAVNIASPAVGFGGETGLAGKVDSHFFARFGSAILLSVLDGLSAIARSGNTIVMGGGQSAAAAAVGQSGQIGPTIRVRQGQPIRVFTARDLDFSRVSSE